MTRLSTLGARGRGPPSGASTAALGPDRRTIWTAMSARRRPLEQPNERRAEGRIRLTTAFEDALQHQ
eukprot:3935118-Pyramimonas_sp.AAC.1